MAERRRDRVRRCSALALVAFLGGACSTGSDDASRATTDSPSSPAESSPAESSPAESSGDDRPTVDGSDGAPHTIAPRPPTTTAPSPIGLHLAVDQQLLGFAGTQGLTGGLGRTTVVVTTTADSGAGSYREALSGGDRIVRFSPALAGESIHLQRPVQVTGSNITLDGSDVDVTIQGHATRFSGTNIVVAGMVFRYNDDVDADDALTFRDATRTQVVGLFGNHFEQAADGLVDFIWNEGNDVYATMCGNSFSHHDKAVLIDSGDDEREGGHYFVTMCRNHWNDVYQRSPLSRNADVHQFNSLFERYGQPDGNGGGSKAGGDGEGRSEHLLENNMAVPREDGERTWEGAVVTRPRDEWAGSQLDSDGAIRAVGSWLATTSGVRATESAVHADDVFTPPYEYPLVEAGPELAAVIRSTAGVCRPVRAVRVSPCAPLVLFDDPQAQLDVVVDGGPVDSVEVIAGSVTLRADEVDPGRWRIPISELGDGPVEVRARAYGREGSVVESDVAIVALVP